MSEAHQAAAKNLVQMFIKEVNSFGTLGAHWDFLENEIVRIVEAAEKKGRLDAAKIAEERVLVNQGCINSAKSKMGIDGLQYHQQHIWEFQALRDEANLIFKAIREEVL